MSMSCVVCSYFVLCMFNVCSTCLKYNTTSTLSFACVLSYMYCSCIGSAAGIKFPLRCRLVAENTIGTGVSISVGFPSRSIFYVLFSY